MLNLENSLQPLEATSAEGFSNDDSSSLKRLSLVPPLEADILSPVDMSFEPAASSSPPISPKLLETVMQELRTRRRSQ